MTNDQPHEVPFARLEKLGPYSNWEQMHQLAAAVVYQQVQKKARSTTKHCARVGYEAAMEMYSQMMQIEWVDKPDFLQGVGNHIRPRIKELVYDRFARTITVRNISTLQYLPSPTVVPQYKLTAALTGPPASLWLGTSAAVVRTCAQDSNRHNCDFCYLNIEDGANNHYFRCEASDMPDRCQNCRAIGRPCTMTPLSNISPVAADICYGRPAMHNIAYAIEPPDFEDYGGGESDNEDQDTDETSGSQSSDE